MTEATSFLQESLYRIGHIVYEMESAYVESSARSSTESSNIDSWIETAKRILSHLHTKPEPAQSARAFS